MEYDMIMDLTEFLSVQDAFSISSICRRLNHVLYHILYLDMSSDGKVDVEDEEVNISNFIHLTNLDLSFCTKVRSIKNLTNLISLNLMDNDIICDISRLTKLQRLTISSSDCVPYMFNLIHLTELNSYWDIPFPDISRYSNLVKLDLGCNRYIDDIS